MLHNKGGLHAMGAPDVWLVVGIDADEPGGQM
jgi:hypothetical protein